MSLLKTTAQSLLVMVLNKVTFTNWGQLCQPFRWRALVVIALLCVEATEHQVKSLRSHYMNFQRFSCSSCCCKISQECPFSCPGVDLDLCCFVADFQSSLQSSSLTILRPGKSLLHHFDLYFNLLSRCDALVGCACWPT